MALSRMAAAVTGYPVWHSYANADTLRVARALTHTVTVRTVCGSYARTVTARTRTHRPRRPHSHPPGSRKFRGRMRRLRIRSVREPLARGSPSGATGCGTRPWPGMTGKSPRATVTAAAATAGPPPRRLRLCGARVQCGGSRRRSGAKAAAAFVLHRAG